MATVHHPGGFYTLVVVLEAPLTLWGYPYGLLLKNRTCIAWFHSVSVNGTYSTSSTTQQDNDKIMPSTSILFFQKLEAYRDMEKVPFRSATNQTAQAKLTKFKLCFTRLNFSASHSLRNSVVETWATVWSLWTLYQTSCSGNYPSVYHTCPQQMTQIISLTGLIFQKPK